MTLWFDSGWPPPLSGVTGYAGFLFYLSPGDGRRPDPTKAQLQAFLTAGLDLAPIWQAGKVDIAAGGFNLGAQHAKAANADADAKGVPSGVPIIYACDADRTLAQVQDYYRGVMSVPGRPVGAYGSADLCDALHDSLGVRYFMQTLAWSRGRVSSNAQFYQRDPNVPVAGTAVDQVVPLKPYPTWRNPLMAYPDLTANAQFIQAAHVSSGSNLPPTRVVIHCTISKTQVGGAVGTANGFANPSSGGSAHYIVDPGTVVQSVREAAIAWHAPPNAHSFGIEMTDLCQWQAYPNANAGQMDSRFANNEGAFHARWGLPDWQQMLARTALVARHLCDTYGIPVRRIGVNDLKAGAKGICGHRDVSYAFGQTNHEDPYRDGSSDGDFPWGQFVDLVANPDKAVAIMNGSVAPAPVPPAPPAPAPKLQPKGKDMYILITDNNGWWIVSASTLQHLPDGCKVDGIGAISGPGAQAMLDALQASAAVKQV